MLSTVRGDYNARMLQQKDRVGELVVRANSRLENGNYEFDYDTGELRFKTAVLLGGVMDCAALFERFLRDHRTYVPKLMRGAHLVLRKEEATPEIVAKFIT